MTDDERLMRLFESANGTLSRSCTPEIVHDEECDPIGVKVMKDGKLCWYDSREQLVFAYVTKDFT
jgi:hypothetical protein